jgi:hypothetical protein
MGCTPMVLDAGGGNPMKSARRPYQKFLSSSYLNGKTLPPGTALICGWTLAGCAFVASLWVLPFNVPAGFLLFAATAALVTRLYMDMPPVEATNSYRYEFVLTRSEAILFTYDLVEDKQLVQCLALRNVSVGEVFRCGDFCSLTLISRERNLEVPLSLFENAEPILRALQERGITVVSLQDDLPQLAA